MSLGTGSTGSMYIGLEITVQVKRELPYNTNVPRFLYIMEW